MRVGPGTTLSTMNITWPHQFQVGRECSLLSDLTVDYCQGIWRPGPSIIIGDRCYIGRGVEFNVRLGVRLGNDCLIAAGCRFVDHDHGIAIDAGPINKQDGPEAAIVLEDDVWLGANVIVLKGVTIGKGAVVAAAAVVTKSIPPMEIWAGIPARRIGSRQ